MNLNSSWKMLSFEVYKNDLAQKFVKLKIVCFDLEKLQLSLIFWYILTLLNPTYILSTWDPRGGVLFALSFIIRFKGFLPHTSTRCLVWRKHARLPSQQSRFNSWDHSDQFWRFFPYRSIFIILELFYWVIVCKGIIRLGAVGALTIIEEIHWYLICT